MHKPKLSTAIPERAFTPQQVADANRVSRDTVMTWIHTGQLASFDSSALPGRSKPRFKVTESALRQFQQERAVVKPTKKNRRPKNTTRPPPKIKQFFE